MLHDTEAEFAIIDSAHEAKTKRSRPTVILFQKSTAVLVRVLKNTAVQCRDILVHGTTH